MTREKAIAILEQRIEKLERAQANPTLGPEETGGPEVILDPEMIQEGLEQSKDLLQRVKAGDEAAIQEVSGLSETWGPSN